MWNTLQWSLLVLNKKGLREETGFILITVLIILSGLLLLGIFLLDHLLIQTKINHNLYIELKSYYLAMAGIEEAVYRLKKNPFWRTTDKVEELGDGRYRLVVSSDESQINVQSYGIYGQSEYCRTASFSLTQPIHRIK